MGQVCKRIGVTEQTYYRWRKEHGGLRLDQAKRWKGLRASLDWPQKATSYKLNRRDRYRVPGHRGADNLLEG